MLIKVKMSIIVGIFDIYEQDKSSSCSAELSRKKFYNLGAKLLVENEPGLSLFAYN